MPVPAAARKKKFNELAKKDGKLFKLISDNNYPWYIDRLQGGGYIDEYQYNTELIDSLGNFYGFQMHEWISNMRSDYFKLKNLDAAAWSEELIVKEILRLFPFKNIFLEAATAKEYAELFPVPLYFEQLTDNARKLLEMRQEITSGQLLPCDSVMMAPKLEFKLGVKRIMPEIGAQTPRAAIRHSYARGMSRAYKKASEPIMSRGEDSPLLCAIIMLTVKMSGIFTAESSRLNRWAVTEEALAHCKNGF